MKDTLKKIFKNFAVLLLVSAVLGIIVGIIFGEKAAVLSPFGTVFTRLLGMYAVGTAPNVGQLILFALIGVAFSIGCAGVPGGGLAIAVILVNAFGLPVEAVGWIAAVFFYLDVTGTTMKECASTGGFFAL